MNVTSIGDLAQNLMLRSRGTLLKTEISTLSLELSSGQTQDITSRLGGDFAYLTDIDLSLSRIDGFAVAASEARLFTDVAQLSLGNLQDVSMSLSADLLGSVPSSLNSVRETFSTRAAVDLDTAIISLNTQAGGRSLFGGINTDVAPLESAETLLAAVSAAIAGLTDPADIRTAAQTWFDDPGGFQATMYRGANSPLAPIKTSSVEDVTMEITADDAAFRDVLMNMSLAALATDPTLALDSSAQNEVMGDAAAGLLSVQDPLSSLRAELGFSQSRIDASIARNAAELTSLQVARSNLLEADAFQTASRLEEAQFQLESLYAVTVRNSRLSLLNYL